MKKNIQTTKLILFLISIFISFSCEKKDDDKLINDNELIGTWVDTVYAKPSGYRVYELIFNSTSSFTDKSSSYGIYNDQDNDELSGWFVRTGNYEVNNNKLKLISKKVVSWDSFFGGNPVTSSETQIIFENCTFTINRNILELNYITYPADAPENTTRRYKKLDN